MIVSLALTVAAATLAFAAVSRPPLTLEGLGALVRPVASHAYAEGAPPGFSGGFSEQSCDACHFHAAPNAGPGRLALEGVPEALTVGQQYRVTISLTHPGMKLAGFQLTARFKDDGTQAGTLAADASTGARIGIETQSGVQYAGHRREGAAPVSPDATGWTLVWTAPTVRRAVIFHAAANAANGDERADGDYVYTVTREIQPH